MAVSKDPRLVQWAKERREQRQAKNTHQSFQWGPIDGEPIAGAGGIDIHSSDLEQGARDLEVRVRPVLLGLVEWHVRLTVQRAGATRAHSKSTYLFSTPAALRELAAQLLRTADEADKARPRPRPVR